MLGKARGRLYKHCIPDPKFLLIVIDIFDHFADNLEHLAYKNSFLIVVLGDLNVKSEKWYNHDKMSFEGAKIDAVTSGYSKLPTNLLIS